MIIKELSCRQFAGLQKRRLTFEPGMNIILGANETGKSSMIDLMYQLLFQDVKVRKGGTFQNLYFPKSAEGPVGDFVDGTIQFQTESGEYVLAKKWETPSGSCELTLPNGSCISKAEHVQEILQKELVFGKAVFDELVFASQKREQTLLQSLFSAAQQKAAKEQGNVRQELLLVVTKALMESGGIAVEKLETKLASVLKLYDEDWDALADAPRDGVLKRGIHNKWRSACTKEAEAGRQALLLCAYYAVETLAKAQAEAHAAETAVEEANARLDAARAERRSLQNRREDFQRLKTVLERRSDIRGRLKDAEAMLSDMLYAAEQWPLAEAKKVQAEVLRQNMAALRCKVTYEAVEALQKSLETKRLERRNCGDVKDEDVKTLLRLERQLERLGAQLRGLDLTLRVKQLGAQPPELRSVESGALLMSGTGDCAIHEAVQLSVPGVLEVQLLPDGLDAEQVKAELAEAGAAYEALCSAYDVCDAEALQNRRSVAIRLDAELQQLENSIALQLNGADQEALREAYAALPSELAPEQVLAAEKLALCGNASLEGFIGAQEGAAAQYAARYGAQEALAEQIGKKRAEIAAFQEALASLDMLPEEYADIAEPEVYECSLKDAEAAAEQKLEQLRMELMQRERTLGERSAEEYAELLLEKQEEFAQRKAAYRRWQHIAAVVKAVKAEFAGNPVQDIEMHFRAYLSLLSQGKLVLKQMDARMDSSILSGNNQLSYEILSEGTKDTIALAFRLAVLEHLYPAGGGLAVFDDSFTDMDPERRRQACRLIQKFAERNQVIFVSCDAQYLSELQGNVLRFS